MLRCRKTILGNCGATGPDFIVVVDRHCNYSAFNGYRRTPSNYSCVRCLKCGRYWRTKANVSGYRDATSEERTKVI